MTRFELAASSSRTKRATGLRYIPKLSDCKNTIFSNSASFFFFFLFTPHNELHRFAGYPNGAAYLPREIRQDAFWGTPQSSWENESERNDSEMFQQNFQTDENQNNTSDYSG